MHLNNTLNLSRSKWNFDPKGWYKPKKIEMRMVTCILFLMNVHVYLNLTSYELPSRGTHTIDAKCVIVFWAKLTISWWLSLFPQTASQPTKRKLPDWAERPNATVTAATEKKTKKKKGLFSWHSWVLLSCVMYILIFCTKFQYFFWILI